LTLSVGFLF